MPLGQLYRCNYKLSRVNRQISPINGEVHLVNVDKHVCLYVEEGRREGMGRGEMETVNICNSGG